MSTSPKFMLTNRIIKKTINEIIASCTIKKGTIRIKAKPEFTTYD